MEGSGYFGGARTHCYSGPMRSVAWAFCLTAFAVAGPERDSRIEMAWGGMMPDPDRKLVPGQPRPKPLLVYVPSNLRTRDQERFENALQIQQFVLCSRFFQCVRLSESQARQHPLLRLKFKVPCLIVFNSSLKKKDVVRARASAMKAYSAMRRIGQPDYKTPIKETLRQAKVLLGDFDQVDEARNVLGLKQKRLETAIAKGEKATARKLEKEIARDLAQIDAIYKKAKDRWAKIWDLKIKTVAG